MSFFRLEGGASASKLAEDWPYLGGAVLVDVEGTFLLRPSNDVSISLTERLQRKQSYSISVGTKGTISTAKRKLFILSLEGFFNKKKWRATD